MFWRAARGTGRHRWPLQLSSGKPKSEPSSGNGARQPTRVSLRERASEYRQPASHDHEAVAEPSPSWRLYALPGSLPALVDAIGMQGWQIDGSGLPFSSLRKPFDTQLSTQEPKLTICNEAFLTSASVPSLPSGNAPPSRRQCFREYAIVLWSGHSPFRQIQVRQSFPTDHSNSRLD